MNYRYTLSVYISANHYSDTNSVWVPNPIPMYCGRGGSKQDTKQFLNMSRYLRIQLNADAICPEYQIPQGLSPTRLTSIPSIPEASHKPEAVACASDPPPSN